MLETGRIKALDAGEITLFHIRRGVPRYRGGIATTGL